MSVIPYFGLRELPLGGALSVKPFGALVSAGVLLGAGYALRRARRVGIAEAEIAKAILWAVGIGFPLSHIVALAGSERLTALRPLDWLLFWEGMSSFGGFFGALLGLAIAFRGRGSWVPHAETCLQALVIGWIFGRLGCALAHDHVGRPSDFLLAVSFPGGARHDLGLYEFLYTLLVLAPAVWLVERRPRPAGTTIAVIALLYAPARFFADFLRATDLPGSDPRIAGLTLAQYGCVALLGIGFHFWRRSRRERAKPAAIGRPSTRPRSRSRPGRA